MEMEIEIEATTETEIKAPTALPSLLLLNDYCLFDIFDFLDINNSINLAKTCSRLRFAADRIFKKRSKFRLQSRMIKKGEEYIDCLFQHIGRHVTSLHFVCYGGNLNSSKVLSKISNNCKNLKNLECTYSNTLCDGAVQPAYSFDNVEVLTLNNCNHKFTEDFTEYFFKSFHRLKSVIITRSYIETKELETIFENNPNIESFVYAFNRLDFHCQSLRLISNVDRLCLIGSTKHGTHILNLNSLLELNRLTKLRLDVKYSGKYSEKYSGNTSNFLRELGTKGIIEEMHLDKICPFDGVFATLSSFSKLQLLVVRPCDYYATGYNAITLSSIAWPAQLKKLRLNHFDLAYNDLIGMIQQLKNIESIDIGKCWIKDKDKGNFNDVVKLSQIIDRNRKQRLDVVLPVDFVKQADPSKKFLIESELLRILRHQPDKDNTLGIEIHFDGCDFPEM